MEESAYSKVILIPCLFRNRQRKSKVGIYIATSAVYHLGCRLFDQEHANGRGEFVGPEAVDELGEESIWECEEQEEQ